MMKILAIFAGYDKDNIIDDYVLFYLKELKKISDIIYIADCEMPESELNKIADFTIKAISERHGEYDFGSYKRGYIYAKENNILENYDYLILCNDSVFGPFYNLFNIFDELLCYKNSVYGISKHEKDSIYEEHLQSYFLIIPQNVFLQRWYEDFIYSIRKENNKIDIVVNYEVNMSILFKKYGYNLTSLYSSNVNLSYYNPVYLIEKGCIFLKKENIGLTLKEILKIFNLIKNNYDTNLIINYYERKSYKKVLFNKDYTMLLDKAKDKERKLKLKCGWFSFFNIYNNSNILKIVIFGIKIIIKMTPEKINRIAWWIPVKKLRDNFRNKFNSKLIN